jgi:hypothetical protein
MPPRKRNDEPERRERERTREMVEDERGWAGQHGQRPANEEEKNLTGAKPATAASSGKDFPNKNE